MARTVLITTDTLIWVILAATSAVCVVSMLGVFASVIRHETDLHDLRNRVTELRYSYTLQLARMHGQIEEEEEIGAVDILDEDGNIETAEAVELDDEPVSGASPARAAA